MKLTPQQQAMLDGERGWPLQIAMQMLTAVGAAADAPDLIPVTSTHLVIDGTALGEAGRDFLERLVNEGGRFAVPASINAIAVDRTKAEMTPEERDQIRMLDACEKMGALPSCSCNPFIQGLLPAFGEHVAWSESATAPFVNSVLGARTNREGATAVASALTGLTPRCGMHLDESRRGEILLRVTADIAGVDRFSLLGALAGRLAGDRIPVLDGIASPPSVDEYVAFGAAFAIHGAVAMFHIAGITPEAPDIESVFDGDIPDATVIDDDALGAEHARTANGRAGPVDIVSIGCPHASIGQLRDAAALLEDGHANADVKFYIHTNRSTWDIAQAEGVIDALTGAGVSVTADNCAVVSYDRVPAGSRMATNSAKMALFARSVSDAEILFGTTADCIAAGISGQWRSQ
tara:strand:+ start:5394 stop:6608 length:1215 start_codon:yes stop_codon:yes gene_type:complete